MLNNEEVGSDSEDSDILNSFDRQRFVETVNRIQDLPDDRRAEWTQRLVNVAAQKGFSEFLNVVMESPLERCEFTLSKSYVFGGWMIFQVANK